MRTHRLPTRRNYKHRATNYKPGAAPAGTGARVTRVTRAGTQLSLALTDATGTATARGMPSGARLTLVRPGLRHTPGAPDAPRFALGPGLAAFRAWGRAQLAAGRADARGWLPRACPTERHARPAGRRV